MKKLLLIIISFSPAVLFAQQDPILTQYQFNQLWFNPAYAGINNMTSADLQFRKQWSGVDGSPTTTLLNAHTSLVNNKIGLGFSLLNDKIGITKNTEFNLVYAYEIQTGTNSTLSFGLQTGFISLNYDFSELNIDDPSDLDFIGVDDGFTKFNVGFGMFYRTEKFYLGASMPKILNVEEDFDGGSGERYNRHYYLSTGVIFDITSSIKLKPYALVRMAEETPASWDIGASALFADILWAGLFTRSFNDFGINLNLNLNNGLRVSYIGEFGSDVSESSFSTHEVGIGFDFALFDKQAVARRFY